ncbi:hypothetical protein ES707_11018 [subsurface metagenome]
MEGWVKIHRKIRDKGWYKQSNRVHLWLELLLRASNNEREFMFHGVNIKLKPGQLIAGRKSLAESTGLSESCVERTLTFFEKSEQQIEQQKSNRNRLVTILSWKEYQTTGQQTEQLADNKRTTGEQLADTYKKDKKVRELKEEDNSPPNRIEIREELFKSEVFNFKNYPTSMLQEFLEYWTEPNKSGTKMRFELERTWSLKRRLSRWESNDFGKGAKIPGNSLSTTRKNTSNVNRILSENYSKYPAGRPEQVKT